MSFTMVHTNINVFDLEKSIAFYEKALGLTVKRVKEHPNGKFKLVFMGDETSSCQIELTWLADRQDPYNLGDNETHIAFITDDFDAAYQHHKAMDVVCFENKDMGIYFINDPDGYWLEIIPAKR